ncbi:Amino acid/polyamine transporter I [Corchorus capsularis]|uniref:Amino acid/polyamine transporter I n=1 Tax=Corchorus capsularis TaxID=210143 RepID=A0A1R3HXN8_COCAP|nr:Amino acid/polyamine transporter I [Corchorus capsularis]
MASHEIDGRGGNELKKRGCGCSKQDFLPEQSFQNWTSYFKALSETGPRLKDRLLTRSMDKVELHDMRARSGHEMKKTLYWWDLIWFGMGAVMGSGIFVLTGAATRLYSGPAIMISYAISGFAAMLAVMCYTEFCVELPVAGGSFTYLRVELGDLVAFIAAGNILFEYVVAGASVSRSWTSYLATLFNKSPNDFRIHVPSLPHDYNYLDPIAIVISAVICVAACLSVKGSSRFNSIATIIHLVVLAFIVIAGLTKADTENFSDFAPNGIRGILKASSIIFFAYVGFDGVATLGEETKKPSRDVPIGHDEVLLSNLLGQARYFTHIGRTHMAPPFLAKVNERTGTPLNASIVMTCINSVVALFTELEVLSNLLSLATLFIFSLVALALLVRRFYVRDETTGSQKDRMIAMLVLIVGSSIGNSVYWAVGNGGWVGHVVALLIWFGGTLGLQLLIKLQKKPKSWGVPLVPWLPSASFAINLFIMGSIDKDAFIRFGIWTLILVVYYVFIALHASYDAAHENTRTADVEEGQHGASTTNIEEEHEGTSTRNIEDGQHGTSTSNIEDGQQETSRTNDEGQQGGASTSNT